MNTTISQWQRIALLAAGIATSMGSVAWGQELYETHTDGSIWEYTGVPCKGKVCSGWTELDNNPQLSMIAAGGGNLYELHGDGSIWWYIGPACSGGSCPGWVELDNNPLASKIGAGPNYALYELHSDNTLWQWNGVGCSGGYCPGWTESSDNPYLVGLGASANLLVGAEAAGGYFDLFLFNGAFDGWAPIAYGLTSYVVGDNALYAFDGSGIEQYVPSTNNWQAIDNKETTSIMTAGGTLCQTRTSKEGANTLWQYTGTPCSGNSVVGYFGFCPLPPC